MKPLRTLILAATLFVTGYAVAQTPNQTSAQTAAAPQAAADDKPAYASDPKYLSAFNEARALRQDGKAAPARDGFMKANKIAGGACIPCLNRVYELDLELKEYKNAVAVAAQLVTLAPTPRDKSVAEARQGDALLDQAGDKPKPEQLAAVHTLMQAALADHPRNQKALWDDGLVLARMDKLDDAKQSFTTWLAHAPPADPRRVRATHFIENPALARQKMAPAFEIKTMDGTPFNLDEMGGKVVLLDFWATWCGPCVASLPEVQHIAKQFAGQPFVLLSISGDEDAPKWKSFVAQHQMTWPQYRDRDGRISALFDAHLIPHYFLIDSDGVLTTESIADSSAIEGRIKRLVKRANEAKPAVSAAGTQ